MKNLNNKQLEWSTVYHDITHWSRINGEIGKDRLIIINHIKNFCPSPIYILYIN